MPDYYEEKTRNKINKVSGGYTWQIANLAQTNLDLIYAIIKFLAITVVVSQISLVAGACYHNLSYTFTYCRGQSFKNTLVRLG
jgi:hypothetical protein